jgi:hypothetical protein
LHLNQVLIVRRGCIQLIAPHPNNSVIGPFQEACSFNFTAPSFERVGFVKTYVGQLHGKVLVIKSENFINPPHAQQIDQHDSEEHNNRHEDLKFALTLSQQNTLAFSHLFSHQVSIEDTF